MNLLDIDHCIAILRGQLDGLGAQISPDEELATTAVSVAELAHGAQRSQRREDNLARLELLLSTLAVLPFDKAAGRRFGVLKAKYRLKGGDFPFLPGKRLFESPPYSLFGIKILCKSR